MDSVEIARLVIQEVSGVDDPANQSPGFMVRKDAAGMTPRERATASEIVAKARLLRQIHEALDEPMSAREAVSTISKAIARRHDTRHPETGRFESKPAQAQRQVGRAGDGFLMPWKHQGAVHSSLSVPSAYDAERTGPSNLHPGSSGLEP